MENHDILVSVIVPVYGTETYLPACIDSILKQTYTNLQIILVDDQSPDRCPEICDRYAQLDSRIVVIHQHNMGVSGARNTGLRHVIGEYIMFVDSDDELYSNAIDVLLGDAMKYQADIVWASRKEGQDKQNAQCDLKAEKIYSDDMPLLMSLNGGNNTNAVWSKLFRTDFLDEILFEEGQNINEDGFFLFQCYMKQPKVVQHNISVYRYNAREGSASRGAFSEKYLSMLYFCERKKELIARHYPQYMEQANNMEVRTNLQFLEVLCRTTDKKYKKVQRQSIQTVRRLYPYHKPINKHHKRLAWIVKHGLYPLYKWAVRMKYYR